MCGIAGILTTGRRADELTEIVSRMRDSLGHRGPDDVGLYADDGIALAHTRLSIIDLAGGRQPIANEDRTVFLVVNGEIYNYKSLRKELSARGHRFCTKTDSEVIVHLYEDHAERCLEHLDGMFAIALWDARRTKLLLARDRFGIKPLYVASQENLICFASELTSIIKSGLVPTDIDPLALYSYLALSYVPSPMSILKGIRKLRPSERLLAQNGSVRSDIYWQPQQVTIPQKRSVAVKELAGRLEKSVCSHLVSDVPVAAFLSGGVDSSTVVAAAQKHTNMETFCVSFEHTEIDEAPIARRVSEHLGTRHHEVRIELAPDRLLREAVNFMDEPFADSSALPTFAVCRAARQVAKVVLTGDGGDEVFGGYTGRYRVAALKGAVPAPGILARSLRRLPPWRSGRRRSLPEMLELATLPDEERYLLERQITSASDRAGLCGHQRTSEYEQALREIPARPLSTFPLKHPVHRALWMDITTSLADDILTKVDRMSMAHGLEVRVPLLDHHLVEFALSLPPSWLVSPWPVEGKRLLRDTVAPLLPRGILNHPKQGFVAPLNEWLRGHFDEMLRDACMPPSSLVAQHVDPQALRRLVPADFLASPRQDLYAILVLELWLRRVKEMGR